MKRLLHGSLTPLRKPRHWPGVYATRRVFERFLIVAFTLAALAQPGAARTYSSGEVSFVVFAEQAQPGDMYVYQPGWYDDPAYLIALDGVHGTKAQPITIYAPARLTFLDGKGTRCPILLKDCSFIRIGGLNACNSDWTTVDLGGSSDCWIKEVCAWNAGPGNTNVFGIHKGLRNQLEDCAGWGRARKTFSCSQGGDDSRLYRCWGRWERSTNVGPKMTYTWAYHNYRCRMSYCLATWDARMPDEYVLQNNGKPWEGNTTPRPGSDVDKPYGLFSKDLVDKPAESVLDHCVAYLFPDQCCYGLEGGIFGHSSDDMQFSHCISFLPGRDIPPFLLGQQREKFADVHADNLTGFGPRQSFVGPTWQGSGVNGQADIQDILKHWRESPILARIRVLAGEDVLGRLEAIAQAVGTARGR